MTKGGTGDTQRLVKTPVARYDTLSTPEAAKFEAVFSIQKPTLVTLSVEAPMDRAPATITSTTQKWILPGRDIMGDGVIVEIPGFAATLVQPVEEEPFQRGQFVSLTAHVVLMCGCPTSEDRLWDSNQYEVQATIEGPGGKQEFVDLSHAGEPNTYSAKFTPDHKGIYAVWLTVFDSRTGNTGADKNRIIVE